MRGFHRLAGIALVGAAFSLAACGDQGDKQGGAPPLPTKQTRDLVFGGGSVAGVYYQVALQTCGVVNKYGDDRYNCIGRPGLGSVSNINSVSRGLLDFGVAQSDSNWQAWHGAVDWEGQPVANLRSVFSTYPEPVHLLVRADSGITSVDGLKGHAVNIGNLGSGQRGNAEDVLKAYGIDPAADITAEEVQQSEASRGLIDKKIDAFFYTVGLGSAAIQEPASATATDLIDINSAAVKAMVADKPYYVMTTIPGGTYAGIAEPTETYAVSATVVTAAEVPEDVVYDFVKLVFENLEEVKSANPAFKTMNPADMLRGLTAPLHPGAIKYYKEKGLMP